MHLFLKIEAYKARRGESESEGVIVAVYQLPCKNFSMNILERFSHLDIIYVDRRLSIWYVLGFYWVNLGFPHYVQMDCMPDAGYKIQDTFCGRNMVILKLNLVKGKTAY